MTQPSNPDRPEGIDFTKPGAGDPPLPQGGYPPPYSPPQGYPPQPGYGPPQPGYGPTHGYPPQPGYGPQGYAPQPGYGPQGYPSPPGSRMSPAEERTWGGAAHWSALVAAFVALAFLGPLLVLLLKGNDSAFVRRQAVESLNFQLTMLIAAIVSTVLVMLLVGLILLLVVGAVWLVFTIIGAVKASSGQDFRYPLTIRMVS